MALGFISANKRTLCAALKTNSVILVPGGAAEALHTSQDTMTLHLKNRKGFIRLAMEEQKQLIPCIGFGENEIFPTLKAKEGQEGIKGLIWKIQRAFMKITTVSTPVITNIIPRPVKLSVVVGSPIKLDVRKTIDENHEIYIEHVFQLFAKHAEKLGYGHVKLEIV
mmetsp:Transcript_22767/g.33621  ORF Transcript_22767/g.33621 Transcript_22767/m.33621 type:complete len:166 (+) Transcript_22767:450-947(+)|eukprot:CAMPEP_0194208914 /NCGR_PEP_ID=MMETSP0156-20130528/7221_1 /TAXON_ID=33649 /ORGANISM="Thalassionema nitzschioides, Strain L26-B" /LENGTH=165 /DNA_ID=CAMNT_0038935979 /DNA_START=415 /DNA_END=912 /DNA_ORIENTATION=-